MQVGGRRQPRDERGVLDGVPRPVPAPAEHLVGPPRAEDDADGEEAPREQRPASRFDQPAFPEPTRHQGGDSECEGNREADIAEVEHRRVERHQRMVLQQRIRPGTVGGDRAVDDSEGIGGPRHQGEEEAGDDEYRQRRPPDERVGRPLAEVVNHHGEIAGEDDRPEQDRPLQRRPHAGDGEEQRRLATAVLGDILQREVVTQQCRLHGDHAEHGAGQDHPRVLAARLEQPRITAPQPEAECDDAHRGPEQAEPHPRGAKRRAHGTVDGGTVTRDGCLAT